MKNCKFKKMLLMLSVMSSPFVVADVIDNNIASANQNIRDGWVQDFQGNWSYYQNGAKVFNRWIGNYYLGSNGIMLTNTWTPDGYYVNERGKWVKGAVNNASIKQGWYKGTSGSWYYYDKGNLVFNRWIGNYYLGSNGVMLTNTWTPDGYYVDGNGKWVKGAVKPQPKEEVKQGWYKGASGSWYYYDKGRLAVNRWVGHYYLGSNGVMLTNTWTPDGYYVDANGKWVKGAVKPEPKKEEVKNGWIKTNQGQWYYYDKGRMVVNRWIGNYYLGSNGVMLTNTWTPDGYYVDANGKWVENYTKKSEVPVKPQVNNNDKVTYYIQNDSAYANKRYGSWNMAFSGCVPTSIAMIASTFGNKVSPIEVADYLYYNTSSFNKKEVGTSSDGVTAALNNYGLKYKAIYSQEEMDQELSKGNIIYIAVDGNPFTIAGYSHAIVLRGYDSLGRTTVYNPYSAYGIKKYNTSVLWNKKSKDKSNYISGTPAIVVYK